MADQLLPDIPAILDADGEPVSGGSITFYRQDTTNLAEIWADEDGTIPLTNPMPLDAAGRYPQVFFSGDYGVRAVIRTSEGALVRVIDPVIRGMSNTASAAGVSFEPSESNPALDVQEAIENVMAAVDDTVPISRGGTGATTQSDARTNLGLGPLAKAVVTLLSAQNLNSVADGVYSWASGTEPTNAPFATGTLIQNTRGTRTSQFAWSSTGQIATRDGVSGVWDAWVIRGAHLTKSYTSTGQAITSAGTATLTHGLGGLPVMVEAQLECLTAEAGYSIGDYIPALLNSSTASTTRANAIRMNTTQIILRFSDESACFIAAHATTGAATALTNGNWLLHIRAFA